LELGATFWDSADIYADNEDLIGRVFALTGKRAEVFLATKFGFNLSGDGRKFRGDKQYVRWACERSLRRLGTEWIDLYYCHRYCCPNICFKDRRTLTKCRMDPDTPIEETVSAMKQLQDEGKVRYLGLSECSSATLRRACKIARISAVEVEYSPFFTDIERSDVGLLATARELGVAVVAYAPLGHGLLAGKFRRTEESSPDDDFRRTIPRFTTEDFVKNFALVEEIERMAEWKGVIATQLALAWMLRQGEDIFPMPGTTNVKNLEMNMMAGEVKLSDEEDKRVREVVSQAEPFGEKYPEE
jgi:aryl-alcohol dehydrogenase-like predicted oxidoreductase